MSTRPVTAAAAAPAWSRFLPILSWLPNYERRWLAGDIAAGATVAAIVVPEGVAYAGLAGMPPQASLYAAPVALILYAIFGRCRHMILGATSAVSLMSAAIVSEFAPQGGDRFIALSTTLALVAGLLFILFGVARLGFVANFFSEPVLKGFVFGLALVIAIGQAPKLFGLERGDGNFFEKAWHLIGQLGHTNALALTIGVVSLVLLFGMERFAEKIPAALVALVFGIGAVSLFGLDQRGVQIVGAIPGGFPRLVVPDIQPRDVLALLPGAVGLVLVTFAEHIGPVRQLSDKHRYDSDSNQELIGLGTANIGASFVGGFAQGGSLSRSAANDAAGANSQVSGLVAAGLVLLVVTFLTPLFYNLPEATLGAIVLHAIWSLLDVRSLARYRRLHRPDFWGAIVALFGVLTLDTLPGLMLAVAVSLIVMIYRASRPHVAVLMRDPDHGEFGDAVQHPTFRPVPGLLMMRPDAPLFFANSVLLRDTIRQQLTSTDPPARVLLLDLESTSELDVASVDMLGELAEQLETDGVELWLSRVRTSTRRLLDRSGVTERIGARHIYPRVADGVAAFQTLPAPERGEHGVLAPT